jgi:hypothetical protein
VKAPVRLERLVQRDCIDLLYARGCTPVAVPNGAVLSGDARARAIQMAALKKAGLSVGYPDILAYNRDGEVAHFEVKSAVGKLSDAQTEWGDRLTNWGHRWAVVRSSDDVDDCLKQWGWRA